MIGFLINLCRDETGAAAIQYGLIALLIAAAAFVGFEAMGASLYSMIETISSELQTAVQ